MSHLVGVRVYEEYIWNYGGKKHLAVHGHQFDRFIVNNLLLSQGSLTDKILYWGSDFFQYLSCLYKPFATGMFMMFDRQRFHELGGFHEQAMFAEDYLLSQKVSRRRFKIVRGGVFTTNRRFQKMGHLRVFLLFFRTAFNTHNERFYLLDHKYWNV